MLPIWAAKEPVITAFLKARVAFPLFFERAVVEVTPERAYYWPDGDTTKAPLVTAAPAAADGAASAVAEQAA